MSAGCHALRPRRHREEMGPQIRITINVTQINDYVESITSTPRKIRRVTVTNMTTDDSRRRGVDTSAIIMGDYSNGNDGVC